MNDSQTGSEKVSVFEFFYFEKSSESFRLGSLRHKIQMFFGQNFIKIYYSEFSKLVLHYHKKSNEARFLSCFLVFSCFFKFIRLSHCLKPKRVNFGGGGRQRLVFSSNSNWGCMRVINFRAHCTVGNGTYESFVAHYVDLEFRR